MHKLAESKHSSAMTVQTLRVWLCPESLFMLASQCFNSLPWVSTEEFTSCWGAVLCDSRQLLTPTYKVLWMQFCQIHLISCPDRCSPGKRLDPAAINAIVNRAGNATVCSQSEMGLLRGPTMPRGGVTSALAFLSSLPSPSQNIIWG